MERWTGIAERVTAVSMALPARLSKFPFQSGIRRETASINGASSAFLSLWTDSGIPRYFARGRPNLTLKDGLDERCLGLGAVQA